MMPNSKKTSGFTLVELIVVIAILGVLMAVLVPQYIQYVEKSRIAADEAYFGEVAHAMEVLAASEDALHGQAYSVTLQWNGAWYINRLPNTYKPWEQATAAALHAIIGEGSTFKSKKYNNDIENVVLVNIDKNGKTSWNLPKGQSK